MKVAVVGGSLQGVEAAYLAKKAGWEVILIDKKPHVPAAILGDTFVLGDVTKKEALNRLNKGVDLVIPALEDQEALSSLTSWAHTVGVPLAFDPDTYAFSSSKTISDRLFARLGIPAPRPWPDCRFPLIAKPDKSSGSRDVQVLRNVEEFKAHFPHSDAAKDWVFQEYLPGPSYSLEILGFPGNYRALQVIDLHMDAHYDCKRVTAPSELAPQRITEFEDISLKIAEAVNLRGLMDVEVIFHQGKLKVLEIDARLPSQTPSAVFWSTGFNMVEALGDLFVKGALKLNFSERLQSPGGVILEHVKVTDYLLEVCGEHIIKEAGPLELHRNFFGADEAITDYSPGKTQWAATLILTGENRQGVHYRREAVIKEIQKRFGLAVYMDSEPADFLQEDIT